MKPKEELDNIISPIFKDKKKVLFSCGTGITACVLGLGASVIGKDNFAIYDGSWTEWGSKKELPINK
jgi:thiosulfate/3-mercaptopyruvate sulfurtransferase